MRQVGHLPELYEDARSEKCKLKTECRKMLKKKRAMYVQRNIETRSFNHCSSGRAISITYSESLFVALGIRHAKRMLRIMSSPACFALQYFSILSYKIHDFRKENIEHKMCVWIFSTIFI